MIGKSEVPGWRYDFECRRCARLAPRDGAMYCLPIRGGESPLHADDDRVLRCDAFTPANYSIFEEETP